MPCNPIGGIVTHFLQGGPLLLPKLIYNPYTWPYKWVTGAIRSLLIPFKSGRGPYLDTYKLQSGTLTSQYTICPFFAEQNHRCIEVLLISQMSFLTLLEALFLQTAAADPCPELSFSTEKLGISLFSCLICVSGFENIVIFRILSPPLGEYAI